ncbi:variable surface protein Vir35, putative, partial [Plasmodium vivax]
MIGNNGIIFLCNVAESIIFIWINNPYNNMYNFGETVKTLYNGKRSSYIIFQRSLARHVAQKEFNRSNIRNKLLENNSHNNVKCTSDDLTKYSQLKKKELNDLDLYKKLYKHRYSKKNILGKLDCYCEKKIFDKYDQIHDLAEKLQNDKKTFKKKGKQKFLVFVLFY